MLDDEDVGNVIMINRDGVGTQPRWALGMVSGFEERFGGTFISTRCPPSSDRNRRQKMEAGIQLVPSPPNLGPPHHPHTFPCPIDTRLGTILPSVSPILSLNLSFLPQANSTPPSFRGTFIKPQGKRPPEASLLPLSPPMTTASILSHPLVSPPSPSPLLSGPGWRFILLLIRRLCLSPPLPLSLTPSQYPSISEISEVHPDQASTLFQTLLDLKHSAKWEELEAFSLELPPRSPSSSCPPTPDQQAPGQARDEKERAKEEEEDEWLEAGQEDEEDRAKSMVENRLRDWKRRNRNGGPSSSSVELQARKRFAALSGRRKGSVRVEALFFPPPFLSIHPPSRARGTEGRVGGKGKRKGRRGVNISDLRRSQIQTPTFPQLPQPPILQPTHFSTG
ncbi:hypothetical protein IE53DRAFT_264551 [Violaceomyces palustris]|uniref:Uncharacterized protein n=1 Tax=Violaceomyces palustris TaxID=1673888 RepID=A0ACD0NMW9_9BASI|nr:hypothetical protein IE53DRAFT_264551 [Violaceomyces palustris]